MKKALKFFMVLILSVMFVAMNAVTASAAVNENTQTTPDEKYSVIQTVNDTVLAEARNEQAPEIAEENQDEAQSDTTDNSLTLEGDENANEVTAAASAPDTWITGKLTWRDHNNAAQPLRFCKIKIKRTDSLINYTIYEGYTDQNGEYYVEFTNDALDGLVDLEIEVFAEGTDVKVKDADNDLYSDVIEQKDISVGEHTIPRKIYTMDSTLGQALQILQAGICASMYYGAMKGEDVDDVDIIYPHEESKEICFYREAYLLQPIDTIYIEGVTDVDYVQLQPYSSWDVITHEYGHHVANHENIDNYFPGGHGGEDMAEHYKSHFQNNDFDCDSNCALEDSSSIFTENQCKYWGSSLAWGEGYATFFGELAQQYFVSNYVSGNYTSIYTVADKRYTSYNGLDYSIEEDDTFLTNKGENSETAVLRILYDLYDGVLINDLEEDFDQIALSHQKLWDCIISSGKTTLFEFIRYFQNVYLHPSQRSALGELLAAHRLTCPAPTIPNMSINSSIVQFVWNEIDKNRHFTARKFQINFYDENYDLIRSTPIQVIELDDNNVGAFTIDDALLWETIIEYPAYFYVSVTVYEFDGDLNNTLTDSYVTYYESAYTMYFSPGHIHDYTYDYLKNNSLTHKSYCICGAHILENHFFVTGLLNPTCRDCRYVNLINGPIIKPTSTDAGEETYGYLPPENESAYTTENSRTKENYYEE